MVIEAICQNSESWSHTLAVILSKVLDSFGAIPRDPRARAGFRVKVTTQFTHGLAVVATYPALEPRPVQEG
jgi:hypothetical protein